MKRLLIVACPLVVLLVLGSLGGTLGWRHWKATREWKAAEASEAARRFDDAETHLVYCRSVWSTDPKVFLASARVARRSGHFDAARDYLNRCRQLRGDTDAIMLESALLGAQTGHVSEWSDYLVDRLSRDPDHASLIYEALTDGLIQSFHFNEAYAFVEDWLKKVDDPQARYCRAHLRLMLNQKESALEDLDRCLEMDPHHVPAHLAHAAVILEMSKTEEAIAEYKQLLAEDSKNKAAKLGLANAQRVGHQLKDALALVEEVIKADPNDIEAQSLKGQILFEQENYADAAEVLKEAHERSERGFDLPTVHMLAQCFEKLGQKEEVEKYQKQEEVMKREQQRFLQLHADIEEARFDPSPRFDMGALLLQAGNNSQALDCLKSVLVLDPYHKPTHELLAKYYRSQGDDKTAEAHERYLKTDEKPPDPPPDNPDQP
jgi:predicted Zn-dependent protease